MLTDTVSRIKNMEIRGAGRIARAAVRALQEHARSLETGDLELFRKEMESAAALLLATRPTAVSLPNAVHRVISPLREAPSLEKARNLVEVRADEFVESSLHAVEKIGEIGSRHIRDGDVLMTHCNSEAALACILQAHKEGRDVEVYATEVRPRNQGLITVRILNDAGIRTNYIVDSAVRSFINKIDLVITGADAVTVNGAVVNKIGTAQIGLAAHEARTPLIVAAETYKFAPRTILGELVEIEERGSGEVLPDDIAATLPLVRVRNPAFDVMPPEFVDLVVTEVGALPPQMAYTVIRDYLGWDIHEFSDEYGFIHEDTE